MTVDKFLKQIADLLDIERHKCEKEKKCLREALKKLDKREANLESRLAKETSDKAVKKLNETLKVLQVQKKKGEKLLKNLEKG